MWNNHRFIGITMKTPKEKMSKEKMSKTRCRRKECRTKKGERKKRRSYNMSKLLKCHYRAIYISFVSHFLYFLPYFVIYFRWLANNSSRISHCMREHSRISDKRRWYGPWWNGIVAKKWNNSKRIVIGRCIFEMGLPRSIITEPVNGRIRSCTMT
jgi:hypothetical protein